MSTNRIAPVAMALASNATASFPAARFAAMIPEPITQANRKNEPTPSAAIRRVSGAVSGKRRLRVFHSADFPELRANRHLVDAFQGECQKQRDTIVQIEQGALERLFLLRLR